MSRDHRTEPRLRRYSRPLLLVVLVARMVLPAAHAIKVDSAERASAAAPASAVSGAALALAQAAPKPRGHDSASCAVCSSLARGSGAVSLTAADRLHRPMAARARIQPVLGTYARAIRTGPPPRAPPADARFPA